MSSTAMKDILVKLPTMQPVVIDPLDGLVQKAVESGAVDVLERLLAVKQQVHADQARAAFYTSLIGFQNECPVIEKNTKATIPSKTGASFSYSYTPLEDIAHAIRPLLDKHQLGYRWFTEQDKQSLTVTCRISHALGYIEETSLTVPVGTDAMRPAWPVAQSLTYAKRYTLCNALGIVVGGEDDDAQEPVAEAPQQETPTLSETVQRTASKPASGLVISEAQAKRLYAIAKNAGQTDERIKKLINSYGYEHTREIQRKDYELICQALENAPLVVEPERGDDEVPF